jgi:beta-lactamase class A
MAKRILRSDTVSLRASLAPRRRARFAPRWGAVIAIVLGVVGLALLIKTSVPGIGKTLSGGVRMAQARPAFHADCTADPAPLQRELTTLAQNFDGEVGIAVTKAGCQWTVGERLGQLFPQQSVSKLWVSLSVLDAVDRRNLTLDQGVTIGLNDLTLFNQPLRAAVIEQGHVVLPVVGLMSEALIFSDNTANDRLLWTVGGPDRVRATLKRKGIAGIRFGPGERLLQSQTAGIPWTQNLSLGRNFEQARVRLPMPAREAALERYIADPMDGASPDGIARALAGLASGQLLSPSSTAVMMDILSRTHSGPRRLKAGVPEGWHVFHKTGTGQELGGLSTGYNDVGVMRAPDGSYYGIAVLIRRTRQPIPVRMDLMQGVSRAVAQFHDQAALK